MSRSARSDGSRANPRPHPGRFDPALARERSSGAAIRAYRLRPKPGVLPRGAHVRICPIRAHADGGKVQRLEPLPSGDPGRMGPFSRHSSGPDLRDRDYVLTGSPHIAQDDQLVIVDATVRLAVRQPTDDDDLVLGYNPAEEIAAHAVCVVVLRLMAHEVPADELLVGRAGDRGSRARARVRTGRRGGRSTRAERRGASLRPRPRE